jgi:hypothetical protein
MAVKERAQRTIQVEYTRPKLAAYQLDALFCPERYAVCEATTKSGKAQPLDALVYTPSGPVAMGDIREGDDVLTPTGTARVLGIHPQGEQDVYRVTFSDGGSTECTEDHLWEIHANRPDNRRGFAARLAADPGMPRRRDLVGWPRVMPLRDLMTFSDRARRRMWIPVAEPVPFAAQSVPIDPYLLGVLLGDGNWTTQTLRFSSADEEIVQSVRDALPDGDEAVPTGGYDYRVRSRVRPAGAALRRLLREMGLWGTYSHEKFVPDAYRYNTVDVRLAILAGLLDTDGWVDALGQPHIDQTSERLARHIAEIVESLGGLCRITMKRTSHKVCYCCRISHPDAPTLFRLERKRTAARPKRRRLIRTIRSIEKTRRAEVQCIELADPRGLYLTDRMIATHNTVGSMAWLIEQAWTTGKPGRNYWWIAPIFPQARIAFRRIKRGLTQGTFATNESELTISLPNGAVLWFKGSENPDSLYGEDVHAAVIDEASRVKEDAWYAVRSTLTATRGPIRIIGNVKGRRNWAYQLARRAESGVLGWHYSKITAYDAVRAGILEADEVEEAKAILPEHVFKELYLAEPSDDGGNPFGLAAIRACVAPLSTARPEAFGWDLAKSQDWTVGIGLDTKRSVSVFERWQAPWQVTTERIRTITGTTRALVDSTGVGDPILESLQSGRPNYEGYKFSETSKQQLMEGLALAINEKRVAYPDGPIVSELEEFEFVYTRAGVRYRAPDGMFDDCVMALALAVRRASMPRAMGSVVVGSARGW